MSARENVTVAPWQGDLDPGLHLERTGDSLIVSSTHRQRWVAALFVALGLLMLVALAFKPAENQFGLLFMAGWTGLGLYGTLRREVRTVFDLRSRRIVHTRTVAWYQNRWDYSFADVASVGVNASRGQGYWYQPVMTLRNGETRWLSADSYGQVNGQASCAKVVDEICTATSLKRLDIPYRGWWRRLNEPRA